MILAMYATQDITTNQSCTILATKDPTSIGCNHMNACYNQVIKYGECKNL